MKIVQLVYSLDYGGAEIFVVGLANKLSERNDVTLVLLKEHTVNMLPLSRLSERVNVLFLPQKKKWSLKNWFRLYQLLKDLNPDVIHTHLSTIAYAFPFAILKKKPLVHTIHSLAYKDANPVTIKLLRFLFRNFKQIKPVAISNEVLQTVRSTYGAQFTYMIQNGVSIPEKTNNFQAVSQEISQLKFDSNTKVIINVASVKKIKNQLFLVEAINKLIRNNANIILINIGAVSQEEASYFEQVKKVAGNGIHFLGPKQNVGDYLRNSDIFCLTSEYEGLPLSLLEALSVGLLPVCSEVGGIIDVLQKQKEPVGYTFPPNNQDIFERQIIKACRETAEKREQNSKRIRDLYQRNYTMEICAQNYEQLFQQAIKVNGTSS